MRTLIRLALLMALILTGTLVPAPAGAAAPEKAWPVPGECIEGVLPGGALSLTCVPASGWNGQLLVFAHGYTAFNEPLGFYHLQFDDVYLPDLTQQLGFAFAATSYRVNGLAILQGLDDVAELIQAFKAANPETERVLLTGASEGGIITALAAERIPDLIDGGLSMCGPIGDFRRQLNYWGDFRVLYDYFFANLPGNAIDIPSQLIDNWEGIYEPLVLSALDAAPSKTNQLFAVSKAAYDVAEPESTKRETTTGLLWYSVFATEDGQAKLNGNPVDNSRRWYRGSQNDLKLNLGIDRFTADQAALDAIEAYETTGEAAVPLVTLHTTGDEIIPSWNQSLYRAKTWAAGATANVVSIPVRRYGHCNFTITEVLAGFGILYLKVAGQELTNVPPEYDIKPVQREMLRNAEPQLTPER